MPDAVEILAENLREAVKEAHRHVVFGTGTALFLLLLVVQDWWGGGEATIAVPFVDVSASRGLVQALAGAAYFIAGYLAYLDVSRAQRIMRRLRGSPEIREAALMYPSIPTIILTGPRLLALALPPLLFLAATVPALFTGGDEKWQGLLIIMVSVNAPWILLVQQLRHPLSRVTHVLRDAGLARLAEAGLDPDLVARLRPLAGREYANREQFLDAVNGAAGQGLPPAVRRQILAEASDEEGIEN